MFRRHVEILEAKVTLPNLAREFFTGVVARELARFPADELLSNQVRFVLPRFSEAARSRDGGQLHPGQYRVEMISSELIPM
jgi:hypothetical protein